MKLKNSLLIAIATCSVLGLLLLVGFFSNIQLKLADNLYGGKHALNGIVIIAIDDKSLQEIGRWPWNRDKFAEIIPLLGEAKVIGIDVTFTERSTKEMDDKFGMAIKNSKVPIVLAEEYISFYKEGGNILGRDIIVPISELNASEKGYVNIITDNDGVARAVNLDLNSEEKAFSQVVYEEYWKEKLRTEIRGSRFLINFVGSPKSFEYYSFSDVLGGKVNKSEFKDKLILVGATSADLRDTAFVPTSAGKAMPGVEVHANTVQTFIKEDYLQEQSKLSTFVFMLIFGIFMGLLFYKFRIIWPTLAIPVLILGYILFAIMRFESGIIMNLLYVPLTIFFVYVAEIGYKYSVEKKSKMEIRNAFSKYVSANVVNEILKDPSKLKLGGDKEEITVFFSDIRGFTTISEGMSPEKLVHFMNEYLSAMTKIVLKHNGVVDKYIGDAIMAFWGAPIKIKNHAEIACQTSLDMLEELKELNKKWQKEGYPEIKIGIGLNTGEAVIGNMGSYERFDYTAMGDTINLGSRLESQTKEFGVKIIISEATKKAAGTSFITKKLGKVKVKGKNKAVMIYELVGRKK
jgi:adenylate cyclase